MRGAIVLGCWLAASCMASAVSAGERAGGPVLPAYGQECSACHVAYPRTLLPAASWQRIMSNLSNHFGADASIADADVARIATWLSAGAATRREPPPDDRITRSAWFVREHDGVPSTVWKRPAIRSAANCAACHPQADQGNFNEHAVRIPR